MDSDLLTHLRSLETALARRDPAGIEGGLAALIPDDFVEFGASGQVWTAGDIRAMLASQDGMTDAVVDDFEIELLARDVVLATYRMPSPHLSIRSSIWVRRSGRWMMRFHQGTPRADDR